MFIMVNNFSPKSAIILGMHDAIVSLVGLIAGLYVTFTDPNVIIISCIIASAAAALSMATANYLAVKSINKRTALTSGLFTGGAYLTTCAVLILPFVAFNHRFVALMAVFALSILIIFTFNIIFYRGKRFRKHFVEMLVICTIVTITAFFIGEIANKFFGI